MRRHDKRTREQRKADESALFAAGCFGLTLILIGIALLLTGCSLVLLSVDAKDVDEPEAPVVEEYDPAWDIPATESAVCNDVFLGEFTLTAYYPGRCCCGKWASGYTATGTRLHRDRHDGDRGTHDCGRPEGDPLRNARAADLARRYATQLHRRGLRRLCKREPHRRAF